VNAIFIKTEYGVIVELRQWGQDKVKWLDWNAHEWFQRADQTWVSQGWSPISAQEIGRWNGSVDVYRAVASAGSNKSGFRNFGGRCEN